MSPEGFGEPQGGAPNDGADLLDPWPSDAERASEGSLRPRKLEEFVGQARIREQLGIVLE